MTPTIVIVSGMARSGKDTLINEAHDQFVAKYPDDLCVVQSSVNVAKEFMHEIVHPCLGIEDDSNEYTEQQRNFLASIKQILDNYYNWTVNLAIFSMRESEATLMFYQVRECENLVKLREACIDNGFNYVFVYVMRKDRPATGLAFSELMQPDDFPFDLVISTEADKFAEHAKEILDAVEYKDFLQKGATNGH